MQCQTLVTRVFEAYSSLQVCIREGNWGAEEAALWLSLKEDIHRLGRDGQLPDIARQAIAAVSENSAALLRSVLYLEDIAGRDIDILQQEVTRILGHHKHDGRRSLHLRHFAECQAEHHVTHVRSRYLRSSDDLRECGSLRLQAGCLRDWFLTHLPYPYPTYTEKRNLALQDGIPLSKIDSDLTNWRRRSGWAEIRKIYAKGSKEKMKSLLLRVERGEDTRPDLLDRIEGIRRYMDKESDKVGDWVHEVSPSWTISSWHLRLASLPLSTISLLFSTIQGSTGLEQALCLPPMSCERPDWRLTVFSSGRVIGLGQVGTSRGEQ